MRNAVSSANSPAKLMFKSAHRSGMADPESTPLRQSTGVKIRPFWSPVRGLVTSPSCNATDVRFIFNQRPLMGSPGQRRHAQRLLKCRLALLRNLVRHRATDVVLDPGCGMVDTNEELRTGLSILPLASALLSTCSISLRSWPASIGC